MSSRSWNLEFLTSFSHNRILIILNQPFSLQLLKLVWNSSKWHYCADGGANRLYDLLMSCPPVPMLLLSHTPPRYRPNLIKGDLDSLRDDVKQFYSSNGIPVVQDQDQNSTDLMKCVAAVEELEKTEGQEYEIVILGGLAGRLDQTIHTLSYLHKLRKIRNQVFVITDDNVGWVLDNGQHTIDIDHSILGPTCGLLPVGIDETILTTRGLRWNLTDHPSSFDGLVSTSNQFVPGENKVYIKTTRPIWWTAELRDLTFQSKSEDKRPGLQLLT
ncbi:thiamine pyrophosphokinase Thi80 [Dendrothele bispora CBS 962.96]|uniref:Thiamine pyrophosphokinase n=1 Tax=Dendrothele bispora (strain CBS 962.96) TaxID=1314807 RepID=A0A4S8MKB1_DENBC|nr:thiamine pyrophosphokinase Thi80 [Dendrothele bispora CBS 962.96]